MQPQLPPLPEPKDVLLFDESLTVRGFTKGQMREYALAAVAAEREACAKEGWMAANSDCEDRVAAAIRARGNA